MKKDIRQTVYLPYSPETVWHSLTTKEAISQWLMETDFEAIQGYKFQFKTRPMGRNFDGIVHCQVLELKPHTRLSYSWRGGPGDGTIHLDSVVTWTLTPKGPGTELLLEHTGFERWKNFMAHFFMNMGWKSILRKRLANYITEHSHDTAHA
ncbi:MAG: hypothetical protein JWO03_2110 [Bacteroidetes bacterium]|nr:hypothetical protein [Bacteroidota bacterium]